MDNVIEGEITTSPVVSKAVKQGMSFPDAIAELIKGKKITRIEWDDLESYGELKDGYLMIILNGVTHKWIVNDGDLLAIDWIVVTNEN